VNSAPPPLGLGAEAPSGTASWRPTVPLVAAYVRSQLSALLATVIDFAVMVALVELASLHYVIATALGALAGGATAFVLNRHWSFLAGHRELRTQALRYAVVWLGSIGLNCLLVYLMTDGAGLPYTWSKALTAVLVGAVFNFPLHRHFVFR
jgi:putative flippase GtrA